ncbi:MAG TPA: hypothetical protein VMH85_04230 [Terriglobales bacterium]|nr:hypothetical protein [Terriglobales bacterium]
MKTPMEVLRLKEMEILKLRKEIDALRVTARLLFDDGGVPPEEKKQDLRQLIEMP